MRHFYEVRVFVALAMLLAVCNPASGQPSTATKLTLAQSQVSAGTLTTLTASTTSGAAPVTSGQIVFCDDTHVASCLPGGANVLGVAQLTPAGTATLKLRTGIGVHTLLAHFVGITGSAGLAPSTSSAVTLTVTAPATPVPTLTLLTSATQTSKVAGNSIYTVAANVTASNASSAPAGDVTFLASSPTTTTTLGSFALSAVPTALSFTLSPFQSYETGSATAGDYNEDGIPDVFLISANSIGALTANVLLGDGIGSFPPPSTSNEVRALSCDTGYPCVVASGDLNGDGHADLLLLEYSDAARAFVIQTAYGNGNDAFTSGPSYTAALQTSNGSPAQLLLGDFNGDGLIDILVNNGNGTTNSVALLTQRPDHSFAITYPTLASSQGLTLPATLLVADLNNDGRSDLAGTASDGTPELYISNGDGTFAASVLPNTLPLPNNDYLNTIQLADFTGDGIPDLMLCAADRGEAVLYTNNARGAFSAGPVLTAFSVNAGTGDEFMFAMDVNGDGIADLLSSYSTDPNQTPIGSVLLSNGNGTFQSAAVATPLLFPLTPVIALDLNGDGYPDILTLSGGALNQGASRTSAASGSVQLPPGGSLSLVASYPAQGAYQASVSAPVSVNGSSIATTLGIAVPAAVPAGQPVTVTATLAPFTADGFSTDGELIAFSSYGMLASGILKQGMATASFSNLPIGMVNVFAAYQGDSTFEPSSVQTAVTVEGGTQSASTVAGTYVFSFRGALPPQPNTVPGLGAIGYFTADGKGNVTAGSVDLTSATTQVTTLALRGTYSVASDGTVSLQLLDPQGDAFGFAAVPSQSMGGVAQKLSLVGTGLAHSLFYGQALLQTSTTTLHANATYTFALEGDIPCTADICTPNEVATQGAFTGLFSATATGGLGRGFENDGGVYSDLPGLQVSYSQPDSYGRSTITLLSPGSGAMEPRFYIVYSASATTAFLLSTDRTRSFSGILQSQ